MRAIRRAGRSGRWLGLVLAFTAAIASGQSGALMRQRFDALGDAVTVSAASGAEALAASVDADGALPGGRCCRVRWRSLRDNGAVKLTWAFPPLDLTGRKFLLWVKPAATLPYFTVNVMDASGRRIERHTWYSVSGGDWQVLKWWTGVKTFDNSFEASAAADRTKAASIVFSPGGGIAMECELAIGQLEEEPDLLSWLIRERPRMDGVEGDSKRVSDGAAPADSRSAGPEVSAKNPSVDVSLQVVVTDGQTGLPLAGLSAPQARGSWPADEELVCRWEVEARGEGLERHRLVIANKGARQRWLSVSLRVPAAFSGTCSFFDGLACWAAPDRKVRRTEIVNTFPMACVWCGTSGLAVGVEPQEFHSFLESGYDPGAQTLDYGVRAVIDPGTSETVSFITYPFRPDFGHLGAIQAYWDAFPAAFRPLANTDPRLQGGNGPTYAFGRHPPIDRRVGPEWARRCRVTKDWCYAPFIRPGDWFVRQEHFDYTVPGRGYEEAAYQRAEDYHAYRRKRFSKGFEYNSAMCFYVIAYSEQSLAEQKYPDSIMTEFPPGPPLIKSYGKERRMWVSGNRFGEAFRRDVSNVVAELPVPGFAFDSAGWLGGPKHYGPGAMVSPGRAWDEKGVYAEEGIAVGQLWDYMHTLKAYNGRNVGVWANPANLNATYNDMFRVDACMWEVGTLVLNFDSAGPSPFRYLLGRKAFTLHRGYASDKLGEQIDWQSLPAPALYDLYKALYDLNLLLCLRDGVMLNADHCLGVPHAMRHIGALDELCRTGWEPVPAVRSEQRLWFGRYGAGVNTFIAAGNPAPKEQAFTAVVENAWLGAEACLFAEYFGGAPVNEVRSGTTTLRGCLAARQPLIYKALLGVRGLDRFQATVSQEDRLSEQVLRAHITVGAAARAEVVARVPKHGRVTSASVNGAAVAVGPDARFGAELRAGTNAIVVRFASSRFLLSKEELLDYPFVTNGVPACAIVTGDQPDANEQLAAWKIQDYFRFWHAQHQPPAEVLIPIRKVSEVTGRSNLVFIGLPGPDLALGSSFVPAGPEGSVQRLVPEKVLLIAGTNTEQTVEVLWDTLAALDERYPYVGEFPYQRFASEPTPTGALRKKAGLFGPGVVLGERR